jgi:hypothetical protein
MARPKVADGGDSLQFWRVAANISVGIATGYGLDDQGEREFEFR